MSSENFGKIVSLDAKRLAKERAEGPNRDLENIETRVHPEADDPKPYAPESAGRAFDVPLEHFTFTNTMAILQDIRRHIERQGIDVEHKLNRLDGIERVYKTSPEKDGNKDYAAGLEAVEKAQKLF